MNMQQLWLITLPNNKEPPATTFDAIQSKIGSKYGCNFYRFDIPSLVVGTLDSLMSISDELIKINLQVENVVRKIERQYFEIAGSNADALRVKETTVEAFFKKFQWDYAHYQYQGRQLVELVGQIQSMTAKVEEDLKSLSTTYTEKNLILSTNQRKKTVNLTTSDLEDFLLPDQIASLDVQDSDNLLTVMVVIPKGIEKEFLDSYASIGSDIASFGGPDWSDPTSVGRNDGRFGRQTSRDATKGSPVVPGSHVKVAEEGDSMMYAITILRGQFQAGEIVDDVFLPGTFVDYVEPLKAAFREKRFLVRDCVYDPTKAGGVDVQIEQSKLEVKQVKATTVRWCKAHFGEVYNGWIHLKVIRAFVESVLRYGLPVDFVSFFMEPNFKQEKEVKTSLTKEILMLRPVLRPKSGMSALEEDEEETFEDLPYVCQSFAVIGAGQDGSG